jgi:sigma-E factor negative regulatory protein RseA
MDAMDKMDKQELISALADGHLQGDAFAQAVEAVAADPKARGAWCAYHVVGEVLRSGRASVGTPPEAFWSRLQEQLQKENPARLPIPVPTVRVATPTPAANDWVWKLAAGVASVAAVTAVGWHLWTGTPADMIQPQLAKAPSSAPVVAEAGAPLLRDPGLDKLLAAHRQLGGATALGTSSGFLRNATFEAPSR